jgi:GTP cyclohydrolase I
MATRPKPPNEASVDRAAAARAIDAFLRAIGRDPAVELELVGTGQRVTEAFLDDLCTGYAVDTRAEIAAATIASDASSIVVVRDIPLVTTCPHHLLPAIGTAAVAMKTRSKLAGLGAIAALVDAHARRLALQEAIGERVLDDLEAALAPEWAACRIVLAHACMIARGERATGSRVETLAVRGADVTTVLAALGAGT